MIVKVSVQTTHALSLEPSEQFDVMNKEGQVARVEQVWATQSDEGNWSVNAVGTRVLKSGKLSSSIRVDTWWHSRSFNLQARRSLIEALSEEVQDYLHVQGVTLG